MLNISLMGRSSMKEGCGIMLMALSPLADLIAVSALARSHLITTAALVNSSELALSL
jgi:hypothetical protein